MHRRLAILGLVLLLAGAAAFSWVVAEQRKAKHLVQEKLDTLNNKVIELSKPVLNEMGLGFLDNLVTEKTIVDESDAGFFDNVVSEKGLQQELAKYKSRKAMREHLYLASLSLLSIGGTISSWCLLTWIVRLFTSGLSRWKDFLANLFPPRNQTQDVQPTTASANEQNSAFKDEQRQNQSHTEKHSQVLSKSGWQSGAGHPMSRRRKVRSKRELLAESASCSGHSAKGHGKIATLYCDEASVEPKGQGHAERVSLHHGAAPLDELAQNIRKAILSDYQQKTLKLEDSLRSQTENLQKQITEFMQVTQSAQAASLEHSKPLNSTIKELAQQVSAIRDYASHQQEKIQKLQDGYDLKIIRAFCLRIIRCIDNLEKRISELSEKDVNTTSLEETRYELLFALESGAVEQFKPEINSEYCGQQKLAEVVKDKQPTEDPDMKGKIAMVLRPGYRYVADENNVKVVRPAQVKLYS